MSFAVKFFGNPVFQSQIPLLDRGVFAGTLIAEYSIERLVRYYVPGEVSTRHAITLPWSEMRKRSCRPSADQMGGS